MAISIEKILTISVGEYAKSKAYDLVGVHFSLLTCDSIEIANAIEGFAEKVPDKAEVVVDYQNNTSAAGRMDRQYYIQMSGTALIPRKNVPSASKDFVGGSP
ncbi:hypothetical protein HYT23_03505 [Candidatus Pacearchaeota archaeon]|nr:hypothetical protein [Candidatus Pacearchaeota archaeon]